MFRKVLLIATLITSAALFGQSQSGNSTGNTAPGARPYGGPLLVTPTLAFAPPPTTVGISDAGRAGISSNAPANAGLQVAPVISPMVYTGGAPLGSATVSVAPSTTAAETPVNDLGPSSFAETAPAGNSVSIAEASARYKAMKGTQNVRSLTNSDVEQALSNKIGVTIAKNMPPIGPGVSSQNAPAQNAQTSVPANGQNISAQTAAGSQPSTSASPSPETKESGSQIADSDADAGSATTPQINRDQPANDKEGSNQLPATATFLPLLGLLGLASGGIGMWFRR